MYGVYLYDNEMGKYFPVANNPFDSVDCDCTSEGVVSVAHYTTENAVRARLSELGY
jgi:hypothetical protein